MSFGFFLINLFIYYFWLRWVFLAARGLSLVVASGATLLLQCAGFSLQWLLLLWSTGSRRMGFSSCGTQLSSCSLRALEHRLSSCGAWAQLLRGMWDLPGPGIEPMSPALAGGFLTTAPPGNSCTIQFFKMFMKYFSWTGYQRSINSPCNTNNPFCSISASWHLA